MAQQHGDTATPAAEIKANTSLSALLATMPESDCDALGQIMGMYGEEIHRFIRFRMRDSVLRRLHDSIDVEQSVFRRFFQRAATGKLALASEDELRGYLFTLAKNRVRELKRSQSAAKRKASFVEEGSNFNLGQIGGNELDPVDGLAENELMNEVRSLVGTDDWQAVVQRLDGRTWKDVAADKGDLPDTLRKRLQTALSQIKNRLLGDDSQ